MDQPQFFSVTRDVVRTFGNDERGLPQADASWSDAVNSLHVPTAADEIGEVDTRAETRVTAAAPHTTPA